MSYVFYDVETTGLSSHFDQILEFAAIRTDHQLNEIERFVVRSQLRPDIIPHPDALRINRSPISRLIDPEVSSHYDMVCAVRDRLLAWSPAIFVGFNSIRFDEEFLRQALYQCLHSPYLTSQAGCGRADVMNLVLDAASSSSGAITVPKGRDGRSKFKLADLAKANGLERYQAHSAVADAEVALELSRRLKAGAPEAWQRFVRFSNKSNVASFIQSEDAFVLHRFLGEKRVSTLLVWVANDPADGALALCLRACAESIALLDADEDALAAAIVRDPSLLVRLRMNQAPALMCVEDLEVDEFDPPTKYDEIEALACGKRDRPDFAARFISAAKRVAPQWPAARHVEQKIYESFWSESDKTRMARFHAVPWEMRLAVVEAIADARSRLLGLRLVHEARPDLLSSRQLEALEQERGLRSLDGDSPLGVSRALALTDELIERANNDDWLAELAEYRRYLVRKLA